METDSSEARRLEQLKQTAEEILCNDYRNQLNIAYQFLCYFQKGNYDFAKSMIADRKGNLIVPFKDYLKTKKQRHSDSIPRLREVFTQDEVEKRVLSAQQLVALYEEIIQMEDSKLSPKVQLANSLIIEINALYADISEKNGNINNLENWPENDVQTLQSKFNELLTLLQASTIHAWLLLPACVILKPS